MKLSTFYFRFSTLLLILPLLCLGGCNNEDDVTQIFTGKTWKLSRLTDKGSNLPFYSGLWNSATAEEASLDKLHNQENSFTVEFAGTDLDGVLMGTTLGGRATTATFGGTWKADGKSNELSITLQTSGTESDPLGKAFIAGLQNVYKYEGDSNQLNLYYKEGQKSRVMGFTRLRN